MTRLRDRASPVLLGALVVALLPLVVAGVRALWWGWYPAGDNAFFAIRARDVLTADHPMLGTWTSASLTAGHEVNNPGPLFFQLLAIPARIDPAGGLVVAMVVLHGAMVVVAALFALRRSATVAAVVLASFAGLFWAMGSELLVEPWQPHALLPAFLAFLVLTWSLARGDLVALPLLAAVGTLLVQTHLSYGPLVAGLVVVAGGNLWRVRRAGSRAAGSRAAVRSPRRAVFATFAILALLWAHPLVEQAARGSEGNLWRVAQTLGEDAGAERVGLATSTRIVAATATLPPWWGRPSFDQALDPGDADPRRPEELPNLPGTGAATAGLVALAALLGLGAWLARRRHDRDAATAAGTAGAAMILAVVTAAAVPIGPLGFAAHQVRWLWPVSVFATGVLLLSLAPPRWARGIALVALVVFSTLALPTHRQGTGPVTEVEAMIALRNMAPQLDRLEGRGVLLVDLEGLRLYEPYSTPLMLELQRRGIDFVVDHEPSVRQLGERRRYTGQADAVVRIVEGARAREPEPGVERVAYLAGTARRAPVAVLVEDR